jgi:hypothetical protein
LKRRIYGEETVSGINSVQGRRTWLVGPVCQRGERGRGTGSGFLVSRPWAVSGTGPIRFPLAFFYFYFFFSLFFSVFFISS